MVQIHEKQALEDPCVFYAIDKFSKLRLEDPFFEVLGMQKPKEDPTVNEYYKTTTKKISENAKYIEKVPAHELVYHRFKYCHEDQSPQMMYMPSYEIMIKLMGLAYITQ